MFSQVIRPVDVSPYDRLPVDDVRLRVVGCDIQTVANDETVALVREAGGQMTGVAPIDLTDPDQARQVVEEAVAVYGGLDVV